MRGGAARGVPNVSRVYFRFRVDCRLTLDKFNFVDVRDLTSCLVAGIWFNTGQPRIMLTGE